MYLFHMSELSLQPLVPPMEWNFQLFNLLEQCLRVNLVNIFGFFFFRVYHFQ